MHGLALSMLFLQISRMLPQCLFGSKTSLHGVFLCDFASDSDFLNHDSGPTFVTDSSTWLAMGDKNRRKGRSSTTGRRKAAKALNSAGTSVSKTSLTLKLPVKPRPKPQPVHQPQTLSQSPLESNTDELTDAANILVALRSSSVQQQASPEAVDTAATIDSRANLPLFESVDPQPPGLYTGVDLDIEESGESEDDSEEVPRPVSHTGMSRSLSSLKAAWRLIGHYEAPKEHRDEEFEIPFEVPYKNVTRNLPGITSCTLFNDFLVAAASKMDTRISLLSSIGYVCSFSPKNTKAIRRGRGLGVSYQDHPRL